jgi:hypothetical protein
MAGKLFTTILLTSGVVVAFIVVVLGSPATATPTAFQDFQYPWQQVFPSGGAEVQGSGYVRVAGQHKGGSGAGGTKAAKVRDHRTNQGTASGNWSGANVTPPPQSPGFGQGGVVGPNQVLLPIPAPPYAPPVNRRDHREGKKWISVTPPPR